MMKKRSFSLLIFITGTVVCVTLAVVLLFFASPLRQTLIQYGVLPSYTERIYIVGTSTTTSIRYVPLGDSLTAGVGAGSYRSSFPYQLAKKLSANGWSVTLQPHGIPGATTADAIASLLDGVIATDPQLVTVLLGVNDVYKNVSQVDFKQNYRHILDRLTRETSARVYIVGIPNIGDVRAFSSADWQWLDDRTRMFNDILRSLAVDHQLPFIDLYTLTLASSRLDGYYSRDNFHPSAHGYELWANILYDHINL